MNNIHKGGCLCGKSRFETYAKPVANIICHCRYCQLRTGSPFGNILYFDKKYFKFITGNLKTYKFITESGREWKNYFCSNCATIIYCILVFQVVFLIHQRINIKFLKKFLQDQELILFKTIFVKILSKQVLLTNLSKTTKIV